MKEKIFISVFNLYKNYLDEKLIKAFKEMISFNRALKEIPINLGNYI